VYRRQAIIVALAPDWFVKHLDVIEHISFGLFAAGVDPAFNALSLEKLEEALDHSVVVKVGSPTHACGKVVCPQEVLPVMTGELGGFNRSSCSLPLN
jgi:hypothetical protein